MDVWLFKDVVVVHDKSFAVVHWNVIIAWDSDVCNFRIKNSTLPFFHCSVIQQYFMTESKGASFGNFHKVLHISHRWTPFFLLSVRGAQPPPLWVHICFQAHALCSVVLLLPR